MAISDANTTRLASVAETTQGTTPATPAFQNVRFTGESFTINTDTVVSNEIRPDRNVPDLIRTGSGAGGGFDFELSYGSFDTYLESLLLGTFTTNVLKNGITQARFFTFEKTFEQGTTDAFHRFTGCEASELSLKIAAGEIITGNFGFMGYGGTTATTAIASSTYAAANSNILMNATSDFANLTTTGLTTTPRIMSADLKITNNARAQRAVGSLNAIGLGHGRFEVNTTLRAYFEDNNAYQAYLNGTSFLLSFTLGSVTANKYTISLPVNKIKSAKVMAGGNNQDVMAELECQALFDSTSAATLTITRAVA